VVWGARTARGSDVMADDYKYLPIRRLADYIEQTLIRSTQWAVFEPNDEPLWAQLRLSIGTFMDGLFRQGAFQGGSRDKAYFVKCDATTTTQADIDSGIVNVHVGFAPLKPAEFVVLYLQQIAGQGDS
jgi:phage tail sheath protein FI